MPHQEGKPISNAITGAIPGIRSVIRLLVRNPADADDILQDTLLTGLLKIHTLKPPYRLDAWLKTIARHKCIDHLKSRHRFPVWENIMKTDLKLIEGIFQDDPELAVDRAAMDRRIDQVVYGIDRLNPVLQDIIRFRYFNGLPVKRIAEVLGIPEGTVKSRLFEARQKLLEELDKGIRPPPDLYPDIQVLPNPGTLRTILRAGYGLCFGAPGKGVGDVEICDMYEYPGPILAYRVRSHVTRETTMWGRRVFEVKNEYSRTTGMDNRFLYYAVDDDSIEMVMRIFCEHPEIRVELPGDDMVPAESRILNPVTASAIPAVGMDVTEMSERVTLVIGERTQDNVVLRRIADMDDHHGGECTESFWTEDGREVLQRLYIGESWRMGDFVTFDKLAHSPEIAVAGKRYRLWTEFVLVNYS